MSYIRLASRLAENSDCHHRHGAVIVKGGRVMATGFNRWRQPIENVSNFNPDWSSIHAEESALSKAGDLKGATMIIVRINRRGEHRTSKPCDKCMERIERAGIKAITYTWEQ